MEVKPGYKRTEVGVIPEEWEVVPVGAITQTTTGPFGTLLKASEYVATDGAPVVSVREIRSGSICPVGETPRVPPSVTRRLPQFLLREGDILFARKGGVERSARVEREQEGWFMGSDAIRVRPADGSGDRYLAYQLQTPRVQAFLLQNATGTTMPSLNQAILRDARVPLPPTSGERQAVSRALKDADELVIALERLLSKKRQRKHGAKQELLTGTRRLPGFAGLWQSRALGSMFTFFKGVPAPREQLSVEGHAYLHYGDIHTTNKSVVDVRQYELLPKLQIPLAKVPLGASLRDGDVVFVDASEDDEGTSKHVVVENASDRPFISGLHTIVARSQTGELVKEYRRYCFQTQAVRRQFRFFCVGTKVSGISKGNLARIELPVPPVDEQRAIAAVLSDMDAEIEALEAKLEKARQLKQGMMQELLTGRIRLV